MTDIDSTPTTPQPTKAQRDGWSFLSMIAGALTATASRQFGLAHAISPEHPILVTAVLCGLVGGGISFIGSRIKRRRESLCVHCGQNPLELGHHPGCTLAAQQTTSFTHKQV